MFKHTNPMKKHCCAVNVTEMLQITMHRTTFDGHQTSISKSIILGIDRRSSRFSAEITRDRSA